jgi:hypothetical protein
VRRFFSLACCAIAVAAASGCQSVTHRIESESLQAPGTLVRCNRPELYDLRLTALDAVGADCTTAGAVAGKAVGCRFSSRAACSALTIAGTGWRCAYRGDPSAAKTRGACVASGGRKVTFRGARKAF